MAAEFGHNALCPVGLADRARVSLACTAFQPGAALLKLRPASPLRYFGAQERC
jgi:hypothetical protein